MDKYGEWHLGLGDLPRLLMKAELKPVQGDRFQPTGFPDLGAAEYTSPDGVQMMLVESAQSMANRFESVCWDKREQKLVQPLKGTPYINVDLDGLYSRLKEEQAKKDGKSYIHVDLDGERSFTNSILEAHRINSMYITGKKRQKDFNKVLRKEIGYDITKPVSFKAFYKTLLKYDPNCLVHGVFLEEIGGRLRVPRTLSAFIEASGVRPVQSGGVKFSHVAPAVKGGEGNVPYSRTEFTAESITAYFNLDLASIRGYGLGAEAERYLVAMSLYKVRRFLREGLRLRTACDLRLLDVLRVTNVEDLEVPSVAELETALPDLIQECNAKGYFADPPITQLK